MVSWWVIDSYFSIQQIQILDIEIMISAYGLLGSFGSRVRSKYIGQNIYTSRKSNFCSEPTPIHGIVQKCYSNRSYSRSHFSRLPQAVAKIKKCLSQKVSNSSKIIDLVSDEFVSNIESSLLHICDQSIVTFGIR